MPEGPRGGPRPFAESEVKFVLLPPEDYESIKRLPDDVDPEELVESQLKDKLSLNSETEEVWSPEYEAFAVEITIPNADIIPFELTEAIIAILARRFRIDEEESHITAT